MTLIDRFMPECELHQVDRVAVAADPELSYRAMRSLDTQATPVARALFRLRTLPDRLHKKGEPERPHRMTIDEITRPGSGFVLLGEEPGRELVVGSVGKFWLPEIEFAEVTADSFAGFDAPGFGKLAWNLRVDPRVGGGAWIAMDLRVGATDPESLAQFRRYWGLIGFFSHMLRRAALRKLRRELGGGVRDTARRVPGDELLPNAALSATHAITIEARPDRVWPWLVQMGCRRAGWYSYDFLDNAGVPSAEEIVPELQAIAVGDILPARPDGEEGFAVLSIDPGRSLVLGSPELLANAPAAPPAPYRMTWAFSLEPIGDAATHLVVRVRAFTPSTMTRLLLQSLVAPAHEVMEREQLSNLKRRAEAHAP